MEVKIKTLAGRVTRRILVWLLLIALGLACIIFYFEQNATREFYAEIYHHKMLVTYEYTRRLISDVYVAVDNNAYYLEQMLDRPDNHKKVMERIVRSGTRIRSCGISFIGDYYPEKGHRFCPYAWRNGKNPKIVSSEDMGDADLDYLASDWFNDFILNDSAQWSAPFYDSHEKKIPLSAYMMPIHDNTGRVVAVLGADVSLDWLTGKLNEMDSTLNDNGMRMASTFGLKANSFIVYQDGRFITHDDEERILKDNFYEQIEPFEGSDVEGLVSDMKAGKAREDRNLEKFVFEGEECFVFYTPVKYTNWLMVTIVPCHAIDVLGILNGGVMFLIVLLALLAIVTISYFCFRNAVEPIKHLTKSVSDIAKGKYDTPMPEMKHNDEIGQLRDAIEDMRYTVSNSVDEMKRTTGSGNKK